MEVSAQLHVCKSLFGSALPESGPESWRIPRAQVRRYHASRTSLFSAHKELIAELAYHQIDLIFHKKRVVLQLQPVRPFVLLPALLWHPSPEGTKTTAALRLRARLRENLLVSSELSGCLQRQDGR